MDKRIARIFEDIGGYFYCDETLDYLDARGRAHKTKIAAVAAAYAAGYTHGVGSGMPGNHSGVRSLAPLLRNRADFDWLEQDHERS